MTTVERAFELAQSGKFERIDQIRRALKSEGYGSVDEHLSASTLRNQLKEICDTARALGGHH